MKNPQHKKSPHRAAHHRNPPPARAAAKETHWADVADWYDKFVGEEGSEYHQHVVIPGVLRMLDVPARKLHVLDLACGQGVLCRRLAQEGCIVTGLDAAAPLIDAAKRRSDSENLPIHYGVADAIRLLDESGKPAAGLSPETFDAITLVLAIQNITPLSPVWQGCRTLLKPNGSLVLVMMHPCFRIPKQSDWLWEEHAGENRGGVQSRLVRQYLTSARVDIQTHPGLAAHGKDATTTPHFHRPLQAYINTLGNAGLLIDHIEEWISHKTSQPGPRKGALDRARKEIPLFLAIRARRVG